MKESQDRGARNESFIERSQQIIIDNRPGAGASIGAEIAARAPRDGYTLFVTTISHAINASLYAKLNYDLLKDFAPVTLLATTPGILVVHPALPVKSVKELIALAKARPGELVYSSAGSGTPTHLAAELFDHLTGIRMIHVPYKGGGPSMIALMSGEASLSFASLPSAISHVKAGKLRALGVTTAARASSLPDVPTISETGLPGYEVQTWYGLSAPAATPSDIISRLHAATGKALEPPDVKERLDAVGMQSRPTTPEQFASFMRSEIEKWAKAVKAANMRVD